MSEDDSVDAEKRMWGGVSLSLRRQRRFDRLTSFRTRARADPLLLTEQGGTATMGEEEPAADA